MPSCCAPACSWIRPFAATPMPLPGKPPPFAPAMTVTKRSTLPVNAVIAGPSGTRWSNWHAATSRSARSTARAVLLETHRYFQGDLWTPVHHLVSRVEAPNAYGRDRVRTRSDVTGSLSACASPRTSVGAATCAAAAAAPPISADQPTAVEFMPRDPQGIG